MAFCPNSDGTDIVAHLPSIPMLDAFYIPLVRCSDLCGEQIKEIKQSGYEEEVTYKVNNITR